MESECKTKKRLTLEFKDAADMYARLEASLVEKTGLVTDLEYTKLRAIADTACSLCTQLRKDLDEHTRRHGC